MTDLIKNREQFKALMKAVAENYEDPQVRKAVAQAIQVPILQLVRDQSLARQLFAVQLLDAGAQASYPIADDFDVPVFILPKVGAVPRNFVELAGEEIVVPTFKVGTACEWALKYARDGRIDIAERCMRTAARAIVDYEEESAWRLLAPAATSAFPGKGLLSARPAPIVEIAGGPAAGFFSKELVNQMIVKMKRTRRTLTDLYVSPEDMADQREWSGSQVDETTRREIFVSGGMNELWSVKLNEVHQLGMTGRYNINSNDSEGGLFKVGTGGQFNDYAPTDANKVDADLNLVEAGETHIYGFDLTSNDSLVMPIREELRFFDDPTLHREQLQGFYGWQELGIAVLDPRMISMGIINRA